MNRAVPRAISKNELIGVPPIGRAGLEGKGW